MAIAGIDIGTTGCKCTIYSNSGELLGEHYEEYTAAGTGSREINPDMVWKKVCRCIQHAVCGNKDVTSLSITSFGEAAVLLDGQDLPAASTILYTDARGEEECRFLEQELGADFISAATGLKPHSNYSVSKLMWIQKHWPEAWKKTKRIFLFSDYIAHMLCGSNVIDYSLAARTMMFDINSKDWNSSILQASGIHPSLLPEPVPTGTPAGKIHPHLAAGLNVSGSLTVYTGCHDQIAAAIGTGVFEEGAAVDGAGTVECITPIFRKPFCQEALLSGNYACVPYVSPDTFVTYAYSFTGGALLKWYRDKLAPFQAEAAKALGMSAYDSFNQNLKDRPSGLLVLPYFAGAATPYMDSSATGAILGLTLETEAQDIYQALMEAVVFEMRVNLERLEQAGICVKELRASGGGARSPYWLQLKSDILNIPVVSLGAAQAGTLGCVMLAGVHSGIYKDFAEAAGIFIRPQGHYLPRLDKHAAYADFYSRYQQLYPLLRQL